MKLNTEPAKTLEVDDVYAKLLALGNGRSDPDARCAMSALILLLINHIGDPDVLDDALQIVSDFPSREAARS